MTLINSSKELLVAELKRATSINIESLTDRNNNKAIYRLRLHDKKTGCLVSYLSIDRNLGTAGSWAKHCPTFQMLVSTI